MDLGGRLLTIQLQPAGYGREGKQVRNGSGNKSLERSKVETRDPALLCIIR